MVQDRRESRTKLRRTQLRKDYESTDIELFAEKNEKRHPWIGMSTDNKSGIQTRAMAQCMENKADTEQSQGLPIPGMNPTVELHETKEEAIKEFVRRDGTIALDWYVADFCNTRVGDLIEQRLPLETTEGKISFSCPTLSEFFKTSNFELDLKTGRVYTYLDPPEDIGVSCQKEEFDLEIPRSILQDEHNASTVQEEKLERIPRVKRAAGPADIMDREEAEYKVIQFCQLWTLYADNSVELKRKSELSQESAVATCKVYVPYISDIIRQLDEVMKIFAIEKEFRSIKNRGHLPVPQITSQDSKIKTARDKDKTFETVDKMAAAMLQAIMLSEEAYMREQNQARARAEQLRSARQIDRSGFNYFTLANSTPIRIGNTRLDAPGVHFNTNPTRHVYCTASDSNNQYKPPINDSIIQTAASTPIDQLATNTTGATDRNDLWRCNNSMGTATGTATHRPSTGPTSHNSLHNDISPNSSDNRNGPICFRCGEQGHMRLVCREGVFCDHCWSYNHDTKACRDNITTSQAPPTAKSKQVTIQQ